MMMMMMTASALQWNESVAPLHVATVVDFGKNINAAIRPWTCSFLCARWGGTNRSTVCPLGISLTQHMQTLSKTEESHRSSYVKGHCGSYADDRACPK